MKQFFSVYLFAAVSFPAFGQDVSNAQLANRIANMEKRLSSKAISKLFDRMDQLQREVQRLRGDVDQVQHAQGRMRDRHKNLYLDLDKRLLDLERAGSRDTAPVPVQEPESREQVAASSEESPAPMEPANAALAGGGAAVAANSVRIREKRPAEAGEEEKIYQEAFVYLNNGRYDDAIADFKRLIESYPSSDYADNSRYWLGETYYVKRQFDTAREHFNRVVEDYPESSKVPDALVKIGYIDYEKSNWKSARKSLKSVVKQYPDTNAAQLANDRLDRMRKEGH